MGARAVPRGHLVTEGIWPRLGRRPVPLSWGEINQIVARPVELLLTKDNISDIGSKPCGEEEFDSFYPVLCGREKWVIKFPRDTMTFT